MTALRPRRRALVACGAVLALVLAAGCGGDGTTDPERSTSIRVRVATSGLAALHDADGYTVALDGGAPVAVQAGAAGSATFDDVSAGTHTVTIDGVASNCSLTGERSRQVTVAEGAVGELDLEVVCGLRGMVVYTGIQPDDAGNPVSSQVFAAPVGGGAPVRLGGDGINTASPAVAPNGRFLAFIETRTDGRFLVTTDLATGTRRDVVGPRGCIGDADWAPDASRLVFVGCSGSTTRLEVVPAEGGAPSVLVPAVSGVDVRDPAWSPDGATIAFSRGRGYASAPGFDLYAVGANGGTPRVLFSSDLNEYTPAWSPDGQRIAYTGEVEPGRNQIWVVNADGTGATQLTLDAPSTAQDPAWAPDGSRIVFALSRGDSNGLFDLWVMNADGTGQQSLVAEALAEIQVSWGR